MDAIRPILQPVTQNLPVPIRDLGVSLIGPQCYKSIIIDIDLTNTQCLTLAVSKALGLGIIAAASVVKVPQLIKLINAQSGEGISILSYLLETAAYLVGLAYNVRNKFPFSTYGETALITIQNVAIASLVLHYGGRSAGAAVYIAGIAGALYALFSEGVVDMGTLAWLQAGAGVLGVASKVPQIWTIWKEGGTGQLSAFAVFNYLLGSLTRIFTTFQEVKDPLILYGFIAGFALNAVLAAQMVYYWNSPASKATPATKLEQPIEKAVGSSSGTTPNRRGPTTRRRG